MLLLYITEVWIVLEGQENILPIFLITLLSPLTKDFFMNMTKTKLIWSLWTVFVIFKKIKNLFFHTFKRYDTISPLHRQQKKIVKVVALNEKFLEVNKSNIHLYKAEHYYRCMTKILDSILHRYGKIIFFILIKFHVKFLLFAKISWIQLGFPTSTPEVVHQDRLKVYFWVQI